MRNNIFDVWLILPFALLGYVWRKLNCELSPFLLGIVLGPMLETQLRRSLTVSHGSWWIFLEHPISACLLAVTALLLLMVRSPNDWKASEPSIRRSGRIVRLNERNGCACAGSKNGVDLMDFGMFSLMQHRDAAKPAKQVIDEVIEQSQLAERMGLSATWFAEHHFSNYALCPSPLLMCAAVARATTRIRVATGVVLLPLYRPSRLVSEIAFVDALNQWAFGPRRWKWLPGIRIRALRRGPEGFQKQDGGIS